MNGKPQPAFVLYINGEQRQGQETMGKELGTMLEKDIPVFLTKLGKTVSDSGMTYGEWNQSYPEELEKIAEEFLKR